MFEHDTEIQQHATFDDRFYEIAPPEGEKEFYPSVSTILSSTQQGNFLTEYRVQEASNKGAEIANYEFLLKALRGTRVHAACEIYCKGVALNWFDDHGRKLYEDDEWKAIVRFAHWMESTGAKVLATEMTVFNHAHRYAGTLDLIVEIEGLVYVVDIKTSKQVYEDHLLQVIGYREAAQEMFPEIKVYGAGVLALNTRHKIGYHWKIADDENEYEDLRTKFLKRVELFHLYHPDFQPKRDILPTTLTPTHELNEILEVTL